MFLADMLLHMVADKVAGVVADIFLLFLDDMLLHMVAGMVADMADCMVDDMTAEYFSFLSFLADMDLDMVATMR